MHNKERHRHELSSFTDSKLLHKHFFSIPQFAVCCFPCMFIGKITNFSSLSWVFNNKYTVSAKGDTFFFFEIGSYYPGSQDPPHMCCDTCAPPRQTDTQTY